MGYLEVTLLSKWKRNVYSTNNCYKHLPNRYPPTPYMSLTKLTEKEHKVIHITALQFNRK